MLKSTIFIVIANFFLWIIHIGGIKKHSRRGLLRPHLLLHICLVLKFEIELHILYYAMSCHKKKKKNNNNNNNITFSKNARQRTPSCKTSQGNNFELAPHITNISRVLYPHFLIFQITYFIYNL